MFDRWHSSRSFTSSLKEEKHRSVILSGNSLSSLSSIINNAELLAYNASKQDPILCVFKPLYDFNKSSMTNS